MAHDVSFINSDDQNEAYYFFGYAGGVFYRYFGVVHFDRGMSGSGESICLNRDKTFDILRKISVSNEAKNYPDPDRFPEFLKDVFSSTASEFQIQFS